MAGELHSPPDDGARARADDVDGEQVRADALADRIAAYAPAGSDCRSGVSREDVAALTAEVDRLRGMLAAHGLDPDCSLCAAGHVPGKPCGEPETFVWADGTIYDPAIPGYRACTKEEQHRNLPANQTRMVTTPYDDPIVQACVDNGGHFWPDGVPEDEPPTCTRCWYNPGWKAGKQVPTADLEPVRDEPQA